MNNEPTVSVIVPVYKVENYINKCVDSIIHQTYENLEIILVDDGSPDKCPEICDEYAKKDARIKVIHKVNGGLSDARNAGIDVASGAYLMFVDSDDWIEPEMVEVLYKALVDNNATMSICNHKRVYENSDNCAGGNNFPIKDGVITGKELLSDLFFNECGYWVISVCKLYIKALFDSVRFPFGKVNEDQFILHKIVLQCEKIACVSAPMYNYLQRCDSITHRDPNIKTLDDAEALFLRADDLSCIDGLAQASLKYLLLGVIKYYKYYYFIGFKMFPELRIRTKELQRLYRKAVRGIWAAKPKWSMRDFVKVFLGYISLYYSGKIIRSIKRIIGKKQKN